MGLAEASGLTAQQAIDKAKEYFKQFYAGENITNVLLEELDFDSSRKTWVVTIGFDVGRKMIRQPSMNALAMLGHEEISPIREARRFIIQDSNGDLVRMENV